MTYRIFLVEDDHSIASGLQHQLEQWDFEVQVVQNFRGVLTECTAFDPHLILMDIMLPCYDGYHWCREIRRVSEVPIIFLSSASDNLNLIMAVNMGGDDFIAKPFDWNVLLTKIQALLRRTYDFGGQAALLEHRGAVLNPSDAVLTYQGMRMELTKNEYRILQALLEQKGKVVSRETLMERLWATDSFVDENTLTVNVNRLRKKLDKAGLHDFIRTKVGMGYLIEQE
ncbi:response regulator transcription factor [Ruminococcus sp.]|uniref:response regulator transcription factor n=1 Tax=Ruminococcus sp. TaxID=41978 RepID=UPI0039932C86